MRLFRERGYSATRVTDLLQATGVDSGYLHNLFPRKKHLLLAVLDAHRRGIRQTLLEPAWRDVTDPIERIFSLLACHRQSLIETDCLCGCPIGNLALEIHDPDPPVRERLAANFQAWTDAVLECLLEAGGWLPDAVDRLSLAEFVLTTMEGAVLQARTFRDVAYFDRAVQELRNYVELLRYGRPSLSDPARQALADIGRDQRGAVQGQRTG